MYKQNKCLPFLILEDGQYKFVGFSEFPKRNDEVCELLITLIKLSFQLRVFSMKITLLIQMELLSIVNLFVVNVVLIMLLKKILIGKHYV